MFIENKIFFFDTISCFLLALMAILLGIRTIFEYNVNHRKEFISFGLTWIFISFIWLPFLINSFFYFFLNTLIEDKIFLFLVFAGYSTAAFFWLISVSILIVKKTKHLLFISASIVILVIYIIFLIIFLNINPDYIAIVEDHYYFHPSLLGNAIFIIAGFIDKISSILLGNHLLKANNSKIQWNGRFLIITLITMLLGAFYEVLMPLTIQNVLFARSVIILGILESYCSFFLPELLFSRKRLLWVIYSVSNSIIIVAIAFILHNLTNNLIIALFVSIGLSLLIIYVNYRINQKVLQKVQLESESAQPEKDDKAKDFFKLIVERKLITQQEITYYKEQKICLVCKTKTSRFVYICPKCNAIYCTKCAKALSDLENICWSCEIPFDPSKPVKKIEPKKEEVEIESIPHKSPKKLK